MLLILKQLNCWSTSFHYYAIYKELVGGKLVFYILLHPNVDQYATQTIVISLVVLYIYQTCVFDKLR